MDELFQKDLRQRIIKSLIIHTIVVTAIVTTNCRQRAVETIAVKKAPAPLEIVIPDTLSKEDTTPRARTAFSWISYPILVKAIDYHIA